MPADALADLDSGLTFALGFWRFALSPAYRAATLARWRGRRGVRHLATVGEILLATTIGLLAPIAVVWMLVVTVGA